MRFRLIFLALLLVSGRPGGGQSARLASKGRVIESQPSPADFGIRRLPCIGEISMQQQQKVVNESLRDYVRRMRAVDQKPGLGPARLRDLMPEPEAALSDELASRSLPRAAPEGATLADRLPANAVPVETENPASAERPSRWDIASLRGEGGEFPEWRRYSDSAVDLVNHGSRALDPYNRNRLKGDFPIFGRRLFLNIHGASDTLTETRRLPTATVPSSYLPRSYTFFSPGESLAVQQHLRIGVSLFHGSADFKPVDWEIKFTPEFNLNYLRARENGVVDISVLPGPRRFDTHFGVQELYVEKRLFGAAGDPLHSSALPDGSRPGSAQFDFASLRLGVQRFTSDFRGFVLSDEQPGARLFGTLRDNRWQYNLAMFHMLEKDTNSGLNTFHDRHQTVYAGNLYWFDSLAPGYNLNFSLLYNNDQPSFLIDKDGFLIRPEPLGTPLAHKVRAGYAGISGDGHIGRIEISHAFYQAFGRDDLNPIAGRAVHINAQLAAVELAYESDWKKFKASILYTSGQKSLADGQARGFDGIVPNQQFAGGGFLSEAGLADRGLLNADFTGGGVNFLNREAIPLSGTAVFLFGPNSLMPTLRPGLFEAQANFVNPGVWVYNVGFDAKWTPKWKASLNVSYSEFDRTEVLEALLLQGGIRRAIGWDTGLGLQYRPKLNNNVVLTGGFGILLPRAGFESLYTTQTLYSGFVLARFQF
jgi:hypothetical protein